MTGSVAEKMITPYREVIRMEQFHDRIRNAVTLLIAFLLLMFAQVACASPEHDEGTPVPSAESSGVHQVLIISGQNNHDWQRTTPLIRSILHETGMFDVRIWNGPGPNTPIEQINVPHFTDFDVVVWDYNPQGQWPEKLRAAWENYIEHGGRAFLIHASNNPFPGWDAFEQMVGLLWRSEDAGCAQYFNADGEHITVNAGNGRGAGHGTKHAYVIEHREPGHPVLAGLPVKWMHANDELYHWQRGPCPEAMDILAVAWDSGAHGGTERYEPLLWQIPYGDGLVMTWLPGHLMSDQSTPEAYQCVGFQTILTRSVEWLATGKVTTPVPEQFPSEQAVSLRIPSQVESKED